MLRQSILCHDRVGQGRENFCRDRAGHDRGALSLTTELGVPRPARTIGLGSARQRCSFSHKRDVRTTETRAR